MDYFGRTFPVVCRTGEVANNYREYLATKHWGLTRARFYESKLFKSKKAYGGINQGCALCKEKRSNLQLHHVTYKRLGRESLWDIIPVCAECHEIIHKDYDEGPKKAGRSNKWRLRKAWKRLRKKPIKRKKIDKNKRRW